MWGVIIGTGVVIFCLCCGSLFCGIAIIACFLWNEWKQNPTQRSWFLFGGVFYVAGGFKYLWSQVLVAFTESFVLQVSIDRRSSSILLKRYADDLFLCG